MLFLCFFNISCSFLVCFGPLLQMHPQVFEFFYFRGFFVCFKICFLFIFINLHLGGDKVLCFCACLLASLSLISNVFRGLNIITMSSAYSSVPDPKCFSTFVNVMKMLKSIAWFASLC